MMNRWRLFELVVASLLLAVGSGLLYYGSVDHSVTAGAVLICGAAFFSLGAMMVVSAVRSILWHRRLLQHAMPHRGSSHRSFGSHRSLLHRHR
jgi:hypothetical protein